MLALEPENITVHTLALKKGSRLMEQGGALPSGEETARMLDYSLECLSGKGYLPTTCTVKSICPAPWRTWAGA